MKKKKNTEGRRTLEDYTFFISSSELFQTPGDLNARSLCDVRLCFPLGVVFLLPISSHLLVFQERGDGVFRAPFSLFVFEMGAFCSFAGSPAALIRRDSLVEVFVQEEMLRAVRNVEDPDLFSARGKERFPNVLWIPRS